MSSSPHQIRSVCVYCGSSSGKTPAFIQQARVLGAEIAVHGLRLVYGGGDNGLMGAIARSAMENGGSVTGIIPDFLQKLEQTDFAKVFGKDLGTIEMITVPDMHTRKQMMFEKADAFVAMPSGIGTLEELVEISTWAQLGRHTKPIILLNTEGFWSPYEVLINHMAESGFLHNPEKAKPVLVDDAARVVPALLASTD